MILPEKHKILIVLRAACEIAKENGILTLIKCLRLQVFLFFFFIVIYRILSNNSRENF